MQNFITGYQLHICTSNADMHPTAYYTNGYESTNKTNVFDWQKQAIDMRAPEQRNENINIQAQQKLSKNFYDEEAIRKIAECDEQIKKWNESLNKRNEYAKWGSDNSNVTNSSFNDLVNRKYKKPKTSLWTRPPARGTYGKTCLGSWSETIRGDNEMSNRQKKKEFYGVGQAWAREDFFLRLPPAQCPFGLKILRGMGWKIGQAIGRQQDGVLEPVVVDVRFGRQGLCTKEEKKKLNLGVSARPTAAKKTHPVTNINGKHPVSLLAEHCMKRQIDMPKYNVVFEYGNIHSKSVLVSVTVGGKTFEPSQPSPYKKHGKAAAARVALKGLGFEKAIIET